MFKIFNSPYVRWTTIQTAVGCRNRGYLDIDRYVGRPIMERQELLVSGNIVIRIKKASGVEEIFRHVSSALTSPPCKYLCDLLFI